MSPQEHLEDVGKETWDLIHAIAATDLNYPPYLATAINRTMGALAHADIADHRSLVARLDEKIGRQTH